MKKVKILKLSPDFRYLEDVALKMASGYVVPILDISPKQSAAKANCAHRKTEIIKQVLKYGY